jgi:high-affinity Fe2+/Pb2+ permease
MGNETMEITTTDNWKPKALLIGGAIGAAVGVAAAYLLVQRSKEDGAPKVTLGEGVKIGVLVFGLLRSITNL